MALYVAINLLKLVIISAAPGSLIPTLMQNLIQSGDDIPHVTITPSCSTEQSPPSRKSTVPEIHICGEFGRMNIDEYFTTVAGDKKVGH
jgi:hypothetical protein